MRTATLSRYFYRRSVKTRVRLRNNSQQPSYSSSVKKFLASLSNLAGIYKIINLGANF